MFIKFKVRQEGEGSRTKDMSTQRHEWDPRMINKKLRDVESEAMRGATA